MENKNTLVSADQLKDILTSQRINSQDLAIQVRDGIISPESLEALAKGAREIMRRNQILSLHTPAVKKLPNGKWYTRINGKVIQRVNRKDLEDLVIEAYKDKKITISSIYDDFLAMRKKSVASTTWSKGHQLYLRFVKDSALARIKLDSIKLKDGYDFLDHCISIKPDLKKKYWSNILGLVNKIFEYAIDEEYIARNPLENLHPAKDIFNPKSFTRDGDTVFTKKEQSDVCNLAYEDAERTHKSEPLGIVLLFNLGIRIGELCGLKWKDVETTFRGDMIHIQREMTEHIDDQTGKKKGFEIVDHCKTPAGDRRLLLNDQALSVLKQIKAYNEHNSISTDLDDLIFVRTIKGKHLPCTPRSFDPRLRRYCRMSGMIVIKSPHDIRRTVLTNLYMAGMPLKKIQQFGGHSSLRQTMDYLRISDDDMDMMPYINSLSECTGVPANIAAFRHEA